MIFTLLLSYSECKNVPFDDLPGSKRLPDTCSVILAVVKGQVDESRKVELVKRLSRKGERVTMEPVRYTVTVMVDSGITEGRENLLKLLIREYLKINGREAAVPELLHYAVLTGDRKLVKDLLRLGLDPNSIITFKFKERFGKYEMGRLLKATPLHIAVYREDTAMISLLVANGAKVNYIGRKVFKPLELAMHLNKVRAVDHLLRVGALLPETAPWIYNILNVKGTEILRILKDYGYPLGRLTLYAAVMGDTDHIRFLMENVPDSIRRLAVKIAAQRSYEEAASYRLKYMISVLKISPYLDSGTTALHWAAYAGSPDAVRYLIREVGLDPHRGDWKGNTLLHYAARSEAWDEAEWPPYPEGEKVVAYLIDTFNLDPNARNDDGNTPLHEAALSGNHRVIKVLIRKGADRCIKNRRGYTPYDLAESDNIKRDLLETRPRKRCKR